jgi:hypothetical protein
MSAPLRVSQLARPFPVVLLAGLLLLLSAVPAEAQRWNQRVQVLKTVEEDGPAYALLDSLVSAFERSDEVVQVKPSPDESPVPLPTLEDDLLDRGLGLVSATHVLIQYEFAIIADDFVETIEELHFIYRSPNAGEEDISLFAVRTDHPLAEAVLMDAGVPHVSNLNTIDSFAALLSFPRLASTSDATIVRLNNETLRDGYSQQRKALTAQLVQMVYDDAMPVMTRTAAPQE